MINDYSQPKTQRRQNGRNACLNGEKRLSEKICALYLFEERRVGHVLGDEKTKKSLKTENYEEKTHGLRRATRPRLETMKKCAYLRQVGHKHARAVGRFVSTPTPTFFCVGSPRVPDVSVEPHFLIVVGFHRVFCFCTNVGEAQKYLLGPKGLSVPRSYYQIRDNMTEAHRDVVSEYEPIGREDLSSERLCRALWSILEEYDGVHPLAVNVQSLLQSEFVTEGNIFLYEVRTALDYHGIMDARPLSYSRKFEHEVLSND